MNLKPNQLGLCLERKCKHEAGVYVELDKVKALSPLVGMQVFQAMSEVMESPCPVCSCDSPKNPRIINPEKKAKSKNSKK